MSKKDHLLQKNNKTEIISGDAESPYIHAATSDNTRLAYQADIADFLKKGGALPATPESIEQYLKDCAAHYNPRTLTRRLTALRQWHKLKGFDDPTQSPLVTKTMRGIARLHGQPRQQALLPNLVATYALQNSGATITCRHS